MRRVPVCLFCYFHISCHFLYNTGWLVDAAWALGYGRRSMAFRHLLFVKLLHHIIVLYRAQCLVLDHRSQQYKAADPSNFFPRQLT